MSFVYDNAIMTESVDRTQVFAMLEIAVFSTKTLTINNSVNF